MKFFLPVIALLIWFPASGQNVPFTSSNLPIIVIKTNGKVIVDEPKIVVDMGIIDNGVGKRNNVTDPYNVFNGKAGIEIRGSSSQMFPKKQYGIELRAANGEDDIEASIFGMPKEADWILFAPYNDKSLMRDALAYRMGRSMGHYATRTRFFELVLNDQYQGIYVFFEKIKRGKNRVPIDKLEKTEVSGDEVTGGYILKVDKTTGGDEGGFVSTHAPIGKPGGQQKIYFQWEYPKAEALVPAQKTYIQNYVKQFEDVLASDQFQDPVNGWTKYADANSFIDYLIMNEVTKNPDAYRLSTFFHKKKDSEGGKLHMGPVWDFNLGFGNVDYCTKGTTTGLVIDFNTICPDDFWLTPFWWKKIWSDAAFRSQLSERWSTLRQGPFATSKLTGYIDSVATVFNAESQQRNFQRWPVLGQYVWPNYSVQPTFDAEVAWLKTWLEARLLYLDATFNFSISGVNESTKALRFTAWPNPFDDQLLLEYEIDVPGTTRIEILDVLGRGVLSVSESHGEAGRYSISTQLNVNTGMYVYRVSHNGGPPLVGKMMRK